MKQGKPSENVFTRSILREIGTYRTEWVKGTGVGNDCAFFEWENKHTVITTQTIHLPIRNAGRHCVLAADNHLASKGAQTVAISLGITVPESYEESDLKTLMREIDDCCRTLSIQIAGGDIQISAYVCAPIVTVTAVGYGSEMFLHESPKKEYDLVVSKYIGIEGTAVLAENKKKELLTRYSESFLRRTDEFEEQLSIRREALLAGKSGVYIMQDLQSGGIFGTLWELSKKYGLGLHVDLKKIPILQETIEICEFFGLNPFQLLSGGSLLMLAEDGEALVNRMASEKIPATVIGTTDAGNDKVLYRDDEIRFLDKTAQDEIFRVAF